MLGEVRKQAINWSFFDIHWANSATSCQLYWLWFKLLLALTSCTSWLEFKRWYCKLQNEITSCTDKWVYLLRVHNLLGFLALKPLTHLDRTFLSSLSADQPKQNSETSSLKLAQISIIGYRTFYYLSPLHKALLLNFPSRLCHLFILNLPLKGQPVYNSKISHL